MNVLLLHPGDPIPLSSKIQWDLIVDFARAPAATYEECGSQNSCTVKSLFDFAHGMDDLHRVKDLVQTGAGILLDDQGIDWWEMFLPTFVPQLQQLLLIERLANEIGCHCNLQTTRSDWRVRALEHFLGDDVHAAIVPPHKSNFLGPVKHYFRAARNLDRAQLQQVLWDKFDRGHAFRGKISRKRKLLGEFVVLPSAYINVSRTAVAYARLLPEQQFLLVCTRGSAQLKHLPPNVTQISLDPYFSGVPEKTLARLAQAVGRLKVQLAASSRELRAAIALNKFDGIVPFMRWGLAMRNAWEHLFESVDATACFSTDDSNPYTRIPLLLAQKRKLPSVACHHGALDFMMAVKTISSDVYFTKSEMEYDYLRRVCRVPVQNMAVAGLSRPATQIPAKFANNKQQQWLVFFSEPFNAMHWRADSVYRDLLPRFLKVAEQCGLKMVFKLHPFESAGAFRRLLQSLPAGQAGARNSLIIAGTPTDEFWTHMNCAIAIQSTVAIECAERGIPVFLCNWLRDPWSEYVQQFERFGIGRVLQHPGEIEDIPTLLPRLSNIPLRKGLQSTSTPDVFRAWLAGGELEKAAVQA